MPPFMSGCISRGALEGLNQCNMCTVNYGGLLENWFAVMAAETSLDGLHACKLQILGCQQHCSDQARGL